MSTSSLLSACSGKKVKAVYCCFLEVASVSLCNHGGRGFPAAVRSLIRSLQHFFFISSSLVAAEISPAAAAAASDGGGDASLQSETVSSGVFTLRVAAEAAATALLLLLRLLLLLLLLRHVSPLHAVTEEGAVKKEQTGTEASTAALFETSFPLVTAASTAVFLLLLLRHFLPIRNA